MMELLAMHLKQQGESYIYYNVVVILYNLDSNGNTIYLFIYICVYRPPYFDFHDYNYPIML